MVLESHCGVLRRCPQTSMRFHLSPVAAASLRAAVRHRRRARPGEAADPCGEEGLREAGRLSGTVCGAGGFCHKRGELPETN